MSPTNKAEGVRASISNSNASIEASVHVFDSKRRGLEEIMVSGHIWATMVWDVSRQEDIRSHTPRPECSDMCKVMMKCLGQQKLNRLCVEPQLHTSRRKRHCGIKTRLHPSLSSPTVAGITVRLWQRTSRSFTFCCGFVRENDFLYPHSR